MLHEISFKSFNERDEVQGFIYVPAAKPKGIVQLIHGFGEHSRRYLHMIAHFTEADYIVTADDHVGHGKTAMMNNTWGNWGDKGYRTMTEDEHALMNLTKEKFPNLPYFLFGHSMGSFIARDFTSVYGKELSGATFCGTAGVFRNAAETGKALKDLVDEGKGEESSPEVAYKLMGWMNERCGEIRLGNEWICGDPYVQLDNATDPLGTAARPVTNRSLMYFSQMVTSIEGCEWASKVPAALPIYNIGGDQDPVGEYGKGVYEVTNWLRSTGHDSVTTKVYPGRRHEIFNYKDIKEEVENGIIAFMDKNL